MHRRLFLQTLCTMGAVTVLSPSAYCTQGSTGTTANSRPVLNFSDIPTWVGDIPKIGLVAVGVMGSALFTNPQWNIPYLSTGIAIDTRSICLRDIRTDIKIQVGDGNSLPVNAHEARLRALAAMPEISNAVAQLDIVLLVVEMDDIDGAGIAPVIAQVLREQKILTLAVSAMPSYFNAMSHRAKQTALAGVEQLRMRVDALIQLSSNDIERAAGPNASLSSLLNQLPLAFIQLSRSIVNSVCGHDEIGIDLDDFQHMLSEKGDCRFGFASASLADGVRAAAHRAINHTFLGCDRLLAASAVLVSIESPKRALLLRESQAVFRLIRGEMATGAQLHYTSTANKDAAGKFKVSIVANGIRRA